MTIGLAVLAVVAAIGLSTRIGSEFMPPLNEGDLLFMPIADPSISLAENTQNAVRQNAALLSFPEVESAVAKVARADTSTDPSPLNMTETIVRLKPTSQWRPGMTLERLRAEMGKAVELPGVTTIWTMPIINRIDMLTTGIRSEVGVKVFGSDLAELDTLARRVADVVRAVPGAANVYPEPLTSGQYLNIRINREAAARYGLSVAAVEEVIESAIGENIVGTTIEGRERFPIRVRYSERFRADPQAVAEALIVTPSGQQVPLGAVAAIEPARGPAMISSENGLARRDNPAERPEPGYRRVRARCPGGRRRAGRTSSRLLRRLERTLRKPGACPAAADDRGADRSDHHLCSSLLHVSLGARSAARAAGSAVRADGRGPARVAAWLQLFRRGLGRIHRLVRHRGPDGRRDGDLSRGSRRAPASRRRRVAFAARTSRGGHRRRASAPASEGHDRLHRHRRPAADHVEHPRRGGSPETACSACARRHGVVAPARAGRDAGPFRMGARARDRSGRRWATRRRLSTLFQPPARRGLDGRGCG